MVTLKQCFEAIGYRITGGGDWGWQCFGDSAYTIESSSIELNDREGEWGFSVVFDTVDQTVYMAEVHDYKLENSYRLINPTLVDAYKKETKDRLGHEEKDVAYDNVKFIDLETVEDFLKKTVAITSGLPYDTTVEVPVDLPDDELFRLMLAAHKRNITLNALIAEILESAVKKDLSQ